MTQASFSALMPSLSTIVPLESESVTTLAPNWLSFSTVYWATLPEPETARHLALEAVAARGEHFLGEIDRAVAGGFGTNQRAAVVEALAGQHAAEAVGQLLVLAEQVADLAAAHADVAGGHVGVGADVAEQLGHERLAETHDFVVALALGIEVAAALAAAHHDRRQAVLEDLLEGQELQQRRG